MLFRKTHIDCMKNANVRLLHDPRYLRVSRWFGPQKLMDIDYQKTYSEHRWPIQKRGDFTQAIAIMIIWVV